MVKLALFLAAAVVAVASAENEYGGKGCYKNGEKVGIELAKEFCKLPRQGRMPPTFPNVPLPCVPDEHIACEAKFAFYANENCADVKALREAAYKSFKEQCVGTQNLNPKPTPKPTSKPAPKPTSKPPAAAPASASSTSSSKPASTSTSKATSTPTKSG